jgi:hypothetical protein
MYEVHDVPACNAVNVVSDRTRGEEEESETGGGKTAASTKEQSQAQHRGGTPDHQAGCSDGLGYPSQEIERDVSVLRIAEIQDSADQFPRVLGLEFGLGRILRDVIAADEEAEKTHNDKTIPDRAHTGLNRPSALRIPKMKAAAASARKQSLDAHFRRRMTVPTRTATRAAVERPPEERSDALVRFSCEFGGFVVQHADHTDPNSGWQGLPGGRSLGLRAASTIAWAAT